MAFGVIKVRFQQKIKACSQFSFAKRIRGLAQKLKELERFYCGEAKNAKYSLLTQYWVLFYETCSFACKCSSFVILRGRHLIFLLISHTYNMFGLLVENKVNWTWKGWLNWNFVGKLGFCWWKSFKLTAQNLDRLFHKNLNFSA